MLYCLKALLVVCFLMPLYRWALPVLEWATLKGAILTLTMSGSRTRLGPGKAGTWNVTRSDYSDSLSFGGDALRNSTFLSFLVVSSLILAMPLSRKARARILLTGILSILIIQSISIALCASGLARLCFDDVSIWCTAFSGILSPWSHVISMSVWIVLIWPHWPKLTATRHS
jgi:hypothetical protein